MTPSSTPSRRGALLLALSLLLSGAAAAQTRWQRVVPPTSPPPRHTSAMAYDPARQRCLLLGGEDGATFLGDAWEWNGQRWSEIPYPFPWGHSDALLAYDPIGRGVLGLLFDGALAGTWLWDGASWSLAAGPDRTPQNVFGAAVATAPSGVLMFGGGPTRPHADTWLWNGRFWTQVRYVVEPPRRAFAHMAFDSSRGRVVMSGGAAGGIQFTDTWTWDPRNGWLPVATGPAPAIGRMVYDAHRDRMVAVGATFGPRFQPPVHPWGTYELDSATQTWRQRSPATEPSTRNLPALAYDERRRQVVMFGGRASTPLSETWLYEPVSPASFGTFGMSCGGASALSLVSPVPAALPWAGFRFELAVRNGPSGPRAFGAMLVGSSMTRWGGTPLPLDLSMLGLTDCNLYVSPDLAAPLRPLPSGQLGWAADVPDSAALIGASFFTQAIGGHVTLPPSQLQLSQAGAARVGGL
ncbi:MAG: hypothetical protein AAF628_35730 [Planctomycetota bacterium]